MPVAASMQQGRARCCEKGFLMLDTVRGVQIGCKRRLKEKQLGNGQRRGKKKKKKRMEKEIC